jgi:uncharacterized protein YeaO (DUF488 family)
MSLLTKRVYEPASAADGYRVLIDRLWPRGVRKADARIDEWAHDRRDSAHSNAAVLSSILRRGFPHESS